MFPNLWICCTNFEFRTSAGFGSAGFARGTPAEMRFSFCSGVSTITAEVSEQGIKSNKTSKDFEQQNHTHTYIRSCVAIAHTLTPVHKCMGGATGIWTDLNLLGASAWTSNKFPLFSALRVAPIIAPVPARRGAARRDATRRDAPRKICSKPTFLELHFRNQIIFL